MKILIRVDGNKKIGLGHLIRCISLSKALHSHFHCEITFLTAQSDLNALNKLSGSGFTVVDSEKKDEVEIILNGLINSEYHILIIDHLYEYSQDDVLLFKKYTKVFMLHNLCEGSYVSDVHVLPSAHHNESILNIGLYKKNNVQFYYGPEYVLINDQIKKLKNKENKKQRIVITTGGSDPKGILIKLIKWLVEENPDLPILAMFGSSFMHLETLMDIKNKLPENVELCPFSLNQYLNAKIAVSTFGVSTYELLYLGIPVVSIAHCNKNALGSAELSKMENLILDLGFVDNVSKSTFINSIYRLYHDDNLQAAMSKNGKKLIRGEGEQKIMDIIDQMMK